MSLRPDVDVFVVFDCDGVLVDSERLVQRAEMQLIAELGWPITIEEVRSEHLGRSTAAVMANIERRIGRSVPADFVRRRDEMLTESFTTELQIVPGVPEALDALDAAGYRSCIASSGSHDRMRLTLGRVGLRERFEGRTSRSSTWTRSSRRSTDSGPADRGPLHPRHGCARLRTRCYPESVLHGLLLLSCRSES
ncbi:hypothetical protein GCM10009819_01630 [Agromyces tropicus]|uniref:HAD family hydrolase n=2 Tax=Agromyces tropicus TaxID=555371 RepID=A0ABP5FD98_9MICO